jgi:bacillolysin
MSLAILRVRLYALAVCLLAGAIPAAAQDEQQLVTISPSSLTELRAWDAQSRRMLRDGDLRIRDSREDTLIAGRVIERADQYYKGVRVFGGDVAFQLQDGVLLSMFGALYQGISVEASPDVDADLARQAVEKASGVELGPERQPELVVLPIGGTDDAPTIAAARPTAYRLAWRLRAMSDSDLREYFVDARDGSIAFDYSRLETQNTGPSAVGRARGVLGDSKKISVAPQSGRFVAVDDLRPPAIITYDMKGDLTRTLNILNGVTRATTSDYASDDDNNWTDGAVDDAHVYQGWTYDYYYKRFGRHGLDNHDLTIQGFANPVLRSDISKYSSGVVGTFFTNAFYAGAGVMVYGVGLPPGFVTHGPSGNLTWDFMSGALDVVAHELTHGVTEFTSNLIYLNESGALNEAFSDIMGTGAEWFFQPPGNGPMQADYLMGEDVVRPGGIRSAADPGLFGDPDHYSRRFLGAADNGGVHINSGIANQAFYLAIEGGTNRTSGLSVQGVGGSNRDQIEKVFYRAFTQLMPANSTFSTARAATIQAARDLYGTNSPAERAVTQAWTAVGVN